MKLLAATYNIQHGIYHPEVLKSGRREVKLDRIGDFLAQARPDFCGINEIYGSGVFGEQPRLLAERLGYSFAFARALENKNGVFGNALLSRYPIKSSRSVEIKTAGERGGASGCWREDRVLLVAEADIGGRALTVMCCHCGLNADEREAAVRAVQTELAGCETPTVLMGDFNMTPDNPMYAVLAASLKDAAAGREAPTYPSEAPKSRIDYIFVSGDIEAEASYIGAEVISDHFPVFAKLRF